MILRSCKVSCPILCYRFYRGLGRLVFLYFVIDIIEDLEGYLSCSLLSVFERTLKVSGPIPCNLCYRGFVRLVVLYFVIDFIEDLEGYLSYALLSML
jgi:hypothetical protein